MPSKAAIDVNVTCTKAKELGAIMYEMSGHLGKIAHLFNRLAILGDEASKGEESDADGTTDDQATAG